MPVTLSTCSSIAFSRIGAIIGLRSDNQVVGPDACRVVAFVADDFARQEPPL
jgi:hypothetical protein